MPLLDTIATLFAGGSREPSSGWSAKTCTTRRPAIAALAGLTLNALFGWWWADPIAALTITVFLVREGFEALKGEED